MKADTHPQYFDNATVTCACGATFQVGSTKESLHTELCSKCHPFYTGIAKFVDTENRVAKFASMVKKSASLKEKKTGVGKKAKNLAKHQQKESLKEQPKPAKSKKEVTVEAEAKTETAEIK